MYKLYKIPNHHNPTYKFQTTKINFLLISQNFTQSKRMDGWRIKRTNFQRNLTLK